MVVKAELGLFQGLDKEWNITRSNFALCFYFFEDFFRHNILRLFFSPQHSVILRLVFTSGAPQAYV